ncbi:hypothetical protein MtrunA17_Chr3g0111851 [Medicago truncatula]|uniref:Transmembrane protein, putative n=1 Tax=Medicago truncatula TaxID=3880 RepID=A0A072V946_MEDTR|nr:transmembrane protein, putative [Medicago truncatula]RHN68250.1 hypothetical protein MtrunA17_Chr3g0111851 [Medicago truncatula]
MYIFTGLSSVHEYFMVLGAPPPRRTVGRLFGKVEELFLFPSCWMQSFYSLVTGYGIWLCSSADVRFFCMILFVLYVCVSDMRLGGHKCGLGFVNSKGSGFINPKGLFGYNALDSSHDLGSSAT